MMLHIVIVLLLSLTTVYGKSSLQLGESLGVNDFLVSSGSTFEFGFIEADNAPGKFIVGIRFHQIDTVVWHAVTTPVSGNARLQLTDQGLLVSDEHQQQPLVNGLTAVVSANLEESGNLIITGGSVWQSFSFPTDTLLQDQLVRGNQDNRGNQDILSSGSFSLYVNENSVGLQSSAVPESNSKSYWDCQRPPTGSKNVSTLLLQLNGVVNFTDGGGPWNYAQTRNSYIYVLDMLAKVTRRLTLERNGNLKIYSLARDNSSWNIVWQALTNECLIYGYCGSFGICTYRPGPVCSCPPGFHFINPEDRSQGCDYNVPLERCNGTTGNIWIRLDKADYNYNDNFGSPTQTSLEECKNICMQNCKCLGIAYKIDGSSICYPKGPDSSKGSRVVIYNGYQDTSSKTVVFLKVSAADSTLPSPDESIKGFYSIDMDATSNVDTLLENRLTVSIRNKIALAFAIALLLAFIVAAVAYGRHFRKEIKRLKREMDLGGATRFTYRQLEVATNFFKHKLGAGGFSTVFKGVLADGTEVAVKNIETLAERQFQAEVKTLGKIHHINLVQLLGYCAEGTHRLLVYEYMPRGSLEASLFSSESTEADLNHWKTRFSIALGIGRGIAYLHEECQECIIHCDIKPENILLGENFCPKVSDFGVAKLMKREGTLNMTTVRGTRGYMAPEWVRNVTITPRVDVYSFGMVLLELIIGRDKFPLQDAAPAVGSRRRHFPVWAFQQYVAGHLESMADMRMIETLDWIHFEVALRIAFWCIQPDPSVRPSMSKVVEMLEGNVVVPEPPFPRIIQDENQDN